MNGTVEAVLVSRRATYADYLAAEQTSECRHEFIDGVIVAMAGGSDEHEVLTASVPVAHIYEGIVDKDGRSLLRG